MMTSHQSQGRTETNPHAFDNGVMARKYGFARNACRKPMADRLVWQQGWDAEDQHRASLSKTGEGT